MTNIGYKKNETEITPSESVVIQDIKITQANRQSKDIASFKQAVQSAESVFSPSNVLLFDIYKVILGDGHLSGIIKKRLKAALNKRLHFYNAKGERVPEMDTFINSLKFRGVLKSWFSSIMWGVSGLEFLPGTELDYIEIPKKHIKLKNKIISYTQYSHEEGIDYTQYPNIMVLGTMVGDCYELGELFNVAPYAIYKSGNMGDWAQYIEMFGQPVRIVYYDAYDNQTKMELKQVLDESGSSLALMIPKQCEFEMKDGKQSNGDGQLQASFKKALDDEMSVVILGQTETTTSSSTSGYAQAETHATQQLEITKDDMFFLCSLLNSAQFISILASYGYPVQGGYFEYEKEFDTTALSSKIAIDIQLNTIISIDADYWYATYGIPVPKTGASLVTVPVPAAEPKPTKTKSLSAILDDLDNETNDNETDNETVETQFIASLHNKPLKGFKPFKGLVEKIKQTLFNFFFHAPLK